LGAQAILPSGQRLSEYSAIAPPRWRVLAVIKPVGKLLFYSGCSEMFTADRQANVTAVTFLIGTENPLYRRSHPAQAPVGQRRCKYVVTSLQ